MNNVKIGILIQKSRHVKGADLLGENLAKENNIPILAFGKKGRYDDIITASSHVIAFPSIFGSGTQHSIKNLVNHDML